ncbi:MAG: hypothetical protein K6F40_05620 [Bacteroidales bacterium]|nr:hypothetical protein [Bacteroidales bacterium]
MDEKSIIKLSESIVSAIVDFSMGKGKMLSLVPGSAAKKLASDTELFNKLKECYIKYLSSVDNKIDESAEVKRLIDFRYELVEIFNQTVPEGEVTGNENEN